MIITLSNAFMTATRMDGFSYGGSPARRVAPIHGGLLRRLWALLRAPHGCRA